MYPSVYLFIYISIPLSIYLLIYIPPSTVITLPLHPQVGVLHRAVESKTAAVGILRAELQECQKERDEFRTLAEQGGGGGATLHRHRPPNLTPNKVREWGVGCVCLFVVRRMCLCVCMCMYVCYYY